jgi:holin-like protein
MPSTTPTDRLTRAVHRHPALQVGIVAAVWAIGELAVRALRLPVPGGLVGLALLLALLATRRIDVRLVNRGAYWLIGEMLLFFVPAVMALSEHRELLGSLGARLFAVIAAGTVLVMAGTAVVVDRYVTYLAAKHDALA